MQERFSDTPISVPAEATGHPDRSIVILLARHGETDWNSEGRWQGHTDRLLTERGRVQATRLAERLASRHISAIYSSDLVRARATAEVVAATRGLRVVEVPQLREIDVGSWAGLTNAEIERQHPSGFLTWRGGAQGWEGGESYEELADRALGAITEVAARHGDGEQILVVSHGDVIVAISARVRAKELQKYFRRKAVDELTGRQDVVVGNCDLVRLRLKNGEIASISRLTA